MQHTIHLFSSGDSNQNRIENRKKIVISDTKKTRSDLQTHRFSGDDCTLSHTNKKAFPTKYTKKSSLLYN